MDETHETHPTFDDDQDDHEPHSTPIDNYTGVFCLIVLVYLLIKNKIYDRVHKN